MVTSRKTVIVTSDGVRLSGLLTYPTSTSKTKLPGICICHGIPLQPRSEDDRGYPALAERFASHGFIVLTFNFRGTGESGGEFDFRLWSLDLEAAMDLLLSLENVDSSRVALVGFSGGAMVSIYNSACNSRACAIAACACPSGTESWPDYVFDAMTEMAASSGSLKGACLKSPAFHTVVKSRISQTSSKDFASRWRAAFIEMDPLHWVGSMSGIPLLVVHGERDNLVSTESAKRLCQSAGDNCKFALIDDGEHRLRTNDDAMELVINWLEKRLLLDQ